MALPDYTFYVDQFYGISIPEPDFPRLSTRANEEVEHFEDVYVLDPRGTWKTEDERKEMFQLARNKAVCAIADALYTAEAVSSQMIPVDENGVVGASSVSIGSVSTSSKAIDVASLGLDLSDKGQKKQFYEILRKYMHVYRGC